MFNDGILNDFSQNQEQRKKTHFVNHCTGVQSDTEIWNTEHWNNENENEILNTEIMKNTWTEVLTLPSEHFLI